MEPADIETVVSMPVVFGVVAAFGLQDRIHVNVERPHINRLDCELLAASEKPLLLGLGDRVLVCLVSETQGVILGRLGPTSAPIPEPPEQLLLEAKADLTLKCGDGSITLRQDGKILIKGKNLVSLALETNRIKGGSVSIN